MTSEKTSWGGIMQYETYEYDERLELNPLFEDRPSLKSLGINEDHEWAIWEAQCKAATMEAEQFIDDVSWWAD